MPTQDQLSAAERLHSALQWNQDLHHQSQQNTAAATVLPLLQNWQRQRLHQNYADLLEQERYQDACEFFLDELYGGKDFSQRHHDLARVEPIMSRIMPDHLLHTVAEALEIQALSIELDLCTSAKMAEIQPQIAPLTDSTEPNPARSSEADDGTPHITQALYAQAYRAAARTADRQRQIELIMEVGQALDSVVHKFWVFRLLKLLRGPAVAAGFGELQHFLEAGFAAFKQLNGAESFLSAIQEREQAAMDSILAGSDRPFAQLDIA